MSEPKPITDEVERAMDRYEAKFGREFPLVFSPGETPQEIVEDIERRIRENDPYPEDWVDPDLVGI